MRINGKPSLNPRDQSLPPLFVLRKMDGLFPAPFTASGRSHKATLNPSEATDWSIRNGSSRKSAEKSIALLNSAVWT